MEKPDSFQVTLPVSLGVGAIAFHHGQLAGWSAAAIAAVGVWAWRRWSGEREYSGSEGEAGSEPHQGEEGS